MSKLSFKPYDGCGECELSKNNCDCRKFVASVKIEFKHDERADNWGHMVTVFAKGEVVKGSAVVKDGVGYCASAASEIYMGYEDFINPKNADIELID